MKPYRQSYPRVQVHTIYTNAPTKRLPIHKPPKSEYEKRETRPGRPQAVEWEWPNTDMVVAWTDVLVPMCQWLPDTLDHGLLDMYCDMIKPAPGGLWGRSIRLLSSSDPYLWVHAPLVRLSARPTRSRPALVVLPRWLKSVNQDPVTHDPSESIPSDTLYCTVHIMRFISTDYERRKMYPADWMGGRARRYRTTFVMFTVVQRVVGQGAE
jgi:hypothetical protein